MSARETIFQAAVSAAETISTATVLSRRVQPTSAEQLPCILFLAGDVRRSKLAYNLAENRFAINVLVVAETMAAVTTLVDTLLTTLDTNSSLAALIQSQTLTSLTEQAELVAQQIHHQQLVIEMIYHTAAWQV